MILIFSGLFHKWMNYWLFVVYDKPLKVSWNSSSFDLIGRAYNCGVIGG
jgi:hypothetical protein